MWRITADKPILTSVKVEGEPRKSLQDLSLRLISLVRFRLIPSDSRLTFKKVKSIQKVTILPLTMSMSIR